MRAVFCVLLLGFLCVSAVGKPTGVFGKGMIRDKRQAVCYDLGLYGLCPEMSTSYIYLPGTGKCAFNPFSGCRRHSFKTLEECKAACE